MAGTHHGVKNVHTLARESSDTIVFLHKVVDGGTDKSYGVQVAALAGVPEEVIRRAKMILAHLERENQASLGVGVGESYEPVQTSLESLTVDDPILDMLKHMDLERTTPIDALIKLKELQEELRSRE